MRSIATVIVGLLLVGACLRAEPAASFRVDCNVPDAGIWIDDVLVGRVADWSQPGRFIRPGFHRIEIRHPGYFTHYGEVTLQDGGGAVVKAELRPLLD